MLSSQLGNVKIELGGAEGDLQSLKQGLNHLKGVADSLERSLLAKHYAPATQQIEKQFLHIAHPETYASCKAVLPTRRADGTPTNAQLANVVGSERDGIDLEIFSEVCTAAGKGLVEVSLLQGVKQITD